jgi:acyl carrier protein
MPRGGDAILHRLQLLAAEVLKLDLQDHELAALNRLDDVTGLDSLNVVLFVVAVEKEFGITLAADELKRETVADLRLLAEHVAHHLAASC